MYPTSLTLTLTLASLSHIVSATGQCGRGLITGGSNFKLADNCFQTGMLFNCGNGK